MTDTALLTTDREHWAAVADELGERLAVDALERDRANREPLAEAALLREARLPGLTVPRELGGAGEGWRTALEAVRRVARGDGSIAQLLGYHYVNLSNLWLAGDPDLADRLGRATAERGLLWGDAVNPIDPDLVLRPDGAGYRLDGTKSFSTGCSSGDVVLAAGTVTTTGEPLLVALDADADGIAFGGDWDNLGQRLSASGSVTFQDVAVPADRVVGSLAPERTTPRSTLITPAIQSVFGFLYLGVAEGALAAAADYTRTSGRPWVLGGAASVREEPYVLAGYGGFAARLRAVAALAERTADHLDAADARGPGLTWAERGELAAEVAALKVVATETALDVTAGLYEFTGARSTANRYGLDRFWRNVRTHTLHDPVAYKRREVGEHYLYGTHAPFTLYT